MKKLILILLCLPLFIFSKEEREYERTMSSSQFEKELKEAADKGIGYTLKNCYVAFDPIREKKNELGKLRNCDILLQDIEFNDTTIEGFIGWFMLSVFIVSLLSQMMGV